MGISIIAVAVASVAMFAVGAFWYMVLFPKQWGQIHGFDKLDKKQQAKMQKEVGPYYLFQLIVTVISAFVLARLIALLPYYSVFALALWVWLGFVMPAQVSSVIFGGTKAVWMRQKIAIMTGESLAHLMVASWVISLLQNTTPN